MSTQRTRVRYILEIDYRGDRGGPQRVIKLRETTDPEHVQSPDLRPATLRRADLRALTKALSEVEGFSFNFEFNRHERSITITFLEAMRPLQRNHATHTIADAIAECLSLRRRTHARVIPLRPVAA